MDGVYQTYREDSKAFREDNDCTVITTAVVCGISYAEAHAALSAKGRVRGRGFSQVKYHEAIREHGNIIERIQLKSKTIRTVERELAENWGGCKVMINVRRHVLAWNGERIVDWTAGRQHRIISAFVVYPQGTKPEPKPVTPPERKPLNRTGHKRTGVVLYCEALSIEAEHHPSLAAAYNANGFGLRGHQGIRKHVKTYGAWEGCVWHRGNDSDWGRYVDVVFHTDDERGREAFAKYFK